MDVQIRSPGIGVRPRLWWRQFDLLSVLAILVALLGGGGALLYGRDIRATEDRSRAEIMARDDLRAKQLARAVGLQISAVLHLADYTLTQLASAYAADPDRFPRDADAALAAFPPGAILRILVIGPDGRSGYATDHSPLGVYLGDRSYFRVHADGGPDRLFIDKPIQPRLAGKWIIPVTRAIRKDGKFLGIVALSLRPEYISGMFSALPMNPGDFVTLLSAKGAILARNRALYDVLGRSLPPDRQILDPAFPEDQTIRATSVIDHLVVDVGISRLPEWSLLVDVGLDEAAELAPFQAANGRIRARVLLIQAVIITMSLALSGFLLGVRRQQRRLRDSERKHRTTVEQAAVGIVNTAFDGRFLSANRHFAEMVGYSQEELLGMGFQNITPPGDREASDSAVRALFTGRAENVSWEKRYRRRDKSLVWARLTTAMLRDSSGRPLHFITVVEDRTAQRDAEARLRLSAGVFVNAREAIVITDADNNIVDVNESFARITGFARAEVVGRNPFMLTTGLESEVMLQGMLRNIEFEGGWSGELWCSRKDGETYPIMLTISTIRNTEGGIENYIWLFADISQQKEHERKLERSAHYDALTALPNRVLLLQRLEHALHQADQDGSLGALAYLDLDGFKAINDRHGHETGDEFLVLLAAKLKLGLRDSDTLARIGGDEFVVVLPDLARPQDCETILARMLATAAEPIQTRAGLHKVSASIGVTFFPQAGLDADQLMRQADQTMYAAKQRGKNCYHFFDETQENTLRYRQQSLERLKLALRDGEFVLFYQPQVNMRSGEVLGAEALIRWQHPERGLLRPDSFLPLLADNPLDVELGDWVIDTALAQLSAWRAQGLELRVSVNVSAQQLQHPDFITRLAARLHVHASLPPQALEVEILESSTLDDIAKVSNVIDQCHALGVRVALDDFGTGYASLNYLRRLPVDVLKIDKSFVRDMLDDDADLTIVQGVMGLASAFQREVIAEGVETTLHRVRLLEIGCDLGQGYAIARPMPAEDLPGWIAREARPAVAAL